MDRDDWQHWSERERQIDATGCSVVDYALPAGAAQSVTFCVTPLALLWDGRKFEWAQAALRRTAQSGVRELEMCGLVSGRSGATPLLFRYGASRNACSSFREPGAACGLNQVPRVPTFACSRPGPADFLQATVTCKSGTNAAPWARTRTMAHAVPDESAQRRLCLAGSLSIRKCVAGRQVNWRSDPIRAMLPRCGLGPASQTNRSGNRVMTATLHPKPRRCASLKAVVLYDGLESGTKAKALLLRVGNRARWRGKFDTAFWRFDVMAQTSVAREALYRAADADMVLVVAEGAVSPPRWLLEWLEIWAATRRIQDAVLAAWCRHHDRGPLSKGAQILRDLAGRYGLHWLCAEELQQPVE